MSDPERRRRFVGIFEVPGFVVEWIEGLAMPGRGHCDEAPWRVSDSLKRIACRIFWIMNGIWEDTSLTDSIQDS